MRLTDFNKSISAAAQFLDKLKMVREVSNPTSLPVNKDFNFTSFSDSATHESIFFCGLELSHYNFILIDYSYFQLSISKEGDLAECRLAFYPNPMSDYDGKKPESPISEIQFYEQMFNEGTIDYEELSQALSEIQVNVTTPIIRYDLSHSQFDRIVHPVAHFHLGLHNSSRIATNKIISPEYFVMFIIRTFYFNHWQSNNCEEFSLETNFHKLKDQLTCIECQKYCELQQGMFNLI